MEYLFFNEHIYTIVKFLTFGNPFVYVFSIFYGIILVIYHYQATLTIRYEYGSVPHKILINDSKASPF